MQQDGTLPANVREELLFWCKASRQHQNHDLVHLARLAEVCKRFLKDSAVSHIASCSLDPILVTYAGDGTPISTRHNICIHSSGESVRRSGRGTSEFYVHHAIVASIDAMGVRRSSVLDMIEHTLKDECLWLSELSDFTWAALSSVCGSSAGELQADVLQCAHVSIGFMKLRFLCQVFSIFEILFFFQVGLFM